MSIAGAMADIALGFSGALGVGFWDARITSYAEVEYDSGGSVIPGTGGPTHRTCSAQVDAATEAMRLQDGYTDEDRRILVLAATLEGSITTDDRIEILAGPFAGTWSIESVGNDPSPIYHELRGRKA